MVKSMTGYGSSAGVSDKLEISIELRSVNNRYLDCLSLIHISRLLPPKLLMTAKQTLNNIYIFNKRKRKKFSLPFFLQKRLLYSTIKEENYNF